MIRLDFEAFALRDGEVMQLFTEPQPGLCIAVMARSVEMPPGEHSAVRELDGAPVVNAAILSAHWSRSKQAWQWMQIAPASKEVIGDHMIDVANVEFDRWYYLLITQQDDTAQSATDPGGAREGDATDWRIGLRVKPKYRGHKLFGQIGEVIDCKDSGSYGIDDANGVLSIRMESGDIVVSGADKWVTAGDGNPKNDA